ncbi:hypothetical protein OAN02_00215 [bacterium]|nr:hypothetical protein [bacterium]
MVDESLCFFEKDVGKKVYEIEYETTYVTKWQVLADNKAGAFDTWLAENKQDLVTEDSTNCVCSYVKDYTQIGKTQVIAEIKHNKEDDEVYADES